MITRIKRGIMKTIILAALVSLPTFAFASSYECVGAGFTITATTFPADMTINGNQFVSADIVNVRAIETFDTTIVGNSIKPASTVKLVIKDGSRASLTVSSPAGIKEHTGLICASH